MTDFLEDLTARRRDKAVANASRINQILAAKIAHDQRIESVWPRDVASDHQLLASIHPALHP